MKSAGKLYKQVVELKLALAISENVLVVWALIYKRNVLHGKTKKKFEINWPLTFRHQSFFLFY